MSCATICASLLLRPCQSQIPAVLVFALFHRPSHRCETFAGRPHFIPCVSSVCLLSHCHSSPLASCLISVTSCPTKMIYKNLAQDLSTSAAYIGIGVVVGHGGL
ncbi:hypothetical protein EV127DRAFT_440283 [Xylaria flabelliformis]|nr:hypothetical protein EV127DRAFT_440283 [Xylaria flabelliformis]